MVDSHSIVNTNSLVHSLSNNKNMGFMNEGSMVNKITNTRYKVLSRTQIIKYNLLGKTFFNSLNFDEQQTLLMYTYRSRDINRNASGEKHIVEVYHQDVLSLILKLDKLFYKFKLEDDIMVFKGANASYFKDLKVGVNFEPKYYFSTSVDRKVAEGFLNNKRNQLNSLMIEIKVPRNSKCIYVGEDSGWLNHKEIILPRDTKYRVLNVSGGKLELEVINDN